jgi:hypothetical protein
MQPATNVIEKVGGVAVMAEITGVHRTRVYGWMRPKDSGGTDGLIPQKHHPAILAFAREKAIAISAEDFLPIQAAPQTEAAQ